MASDTRHKNERAGSEHPVTRPASAHQPDASRREWDTPRRDSSSFSPFAIMRQGLDEMERWFGQISGRGWTPSSSSASWAAPSGNWMPSSARNWMSQMGQQLGDWAPAIEAFQRGNEFVVRAEVPGMTRQDLTVEAGDDSLTIHGERKREQDEEREGAFWSERHYGSFTRVVPLPPGTIADSAKATFHNGILEVVMQTPSPETRRGRRVDISGAAHEGGEKK